MMHGSDDDAGVPEEDRLEITLEDLDQVEEPPAPKRTSAGEPLVVELDGEEDDRWAAQAQALPAPPPPLDGKAEAAPKEYPGLREGAPAAKGEKKGALPRRRVLTSNLLYTAFFGLVGGLLAWLLTEPTISRFAAVGTLGRQVLHEVVFFGIAGLAIGFAIGAVEGAEMKLFERAMAGGAVGMLLGVIGGAAGGALAQFIYGAMSRHYLIQGLALILLRAAGWSIVGTFVAMGPGVGFGSKAKLRNCIIGGALGGLIGGAAFEFIRQESGLSGALNRLIALGTIGFLIGLMVGVVESALKSAWMECIQGPLAGKQFILYERPMSIGAAPHCDIVLFKDQLAAPEHAVIGPEAGHWLITNLDHYYTGTFVNNSPVARQALTDGDMIATGSSAFVFYERAARVSREEVRFGGL
jgi:hypothetical protein